MQITKVIIVLMIFFHALGTGLRDVSFDHYDRNHQVCLKNIIMTAQMNTADIGTLLAIVCGEKPVVDNTGHLSIRHDTFWGYLHAPPVSPFRILLDAVLIEYAVAFPNTPNMEFR